MHNNRARKELNQDAAGLFEVAVIWVAAKWQKYEAK
jgi:hypothetical protein